MTPRSDDRDEASAGLADAVEQAMGRFMVPGVAVGILADDRTLMAGFGVTNVEHPLPVTAQTLFQIGSITKTFVATAIMRLVEAGALALDVPVRTYLPAFRLADQTVAERVTLRHLLTHTAGWDGDYDADFGDGDDALERVVESMDLVPQLTVPGSVFAYNNAGFYVVGRLIEVVTGQPFESAMHELV